MAIQIIRLIFYKFLDVLHESVLTFFLLCDNGRDMQSASIQEVLVQCNGTSYDLRRPRKTTLASRPKPPNLPAAGRPTARTTAHGLCNGGVGLLRLPASAVHCTRACEAVLRLLPNESESGIVAQWPCLTLSLVSARAASDFRGCGCCKHTLFQTNKIYWGSWLILITFFRSWNSP